MQVNSPPPGAGRRHPFTTRAPPDQLGGHYRCRQLSTKRECEKKHRNLTQRFVFCPPLHLSKFFVFVFFSTFQSENQPEHKEFQGLTAPKRGLFRHGILDEIFVFGCLFGPKETRAAARGEIRKIGRFPLHAISGTPLYMGKMGFDLSISPSFAC